MRHGWTIVPAGLVLVTALLGAGGSEAPSADWASLSDGRFGMHIMPIYLVVRPDVQRDPDLELNEHQIKGAKGLLSRLIERGLSLKGKSKEAADAERRAIDEVMTEWFQHELSEAQLERLTQISLQWEGASAIRRTTVANTLDLDDLQRTKVNRLLAERDQRRARGLLTPAELDRYYALTLAVLKPLQKEQWDTLLGRPCRFTIGHPAPAPRVPAGNHRLKAPPQTPSR